MASIEYPFAKHFPDPGVAPPDPGPVPPASESSVDRVNWDRAAKSRNEHISKNRKHLVAMAVDAIIEKERRNNDKLEAAETIALVMGLMLLEGSIEESDPNRFRGIFASMFG